MNVEDNSAPEFEEDITTEFTLDYNKTYDYKLPDIEDNDIDESEVYLNSMENQEFPKFVKYSNTTKTIQYRPENNTDYLG